MTRVYHLLAAKWALDDLDRRRLKVARFDDFNDPFELLAVELSNREKRPRFYRWKRDAADRFGLLCFSRTWKYPVLWSHYADKHRGLCLGFDVGAGDVQDVTYLDERRKLPESIRTTARPGPLFASKGKEWAYEAECRRIVELANARPEGELHFWPFGDDLVLREVVAGARSDVSEGCLRRILGPDLKDVRLTKARLGFQRFEVVPNRLGWARTRAGG